MKMLTSTPTRTALYTVLSACLLIGACATVQAGEACAVAPGAARAGAVTVSYADLDLTTHEGASALYARITHAAHKVCDGGDIRDLGMRAAGQSCEREAVTQAVRAVHSTQLAALLNVKLPQG